MRIAPCCCAEECEAAFSEFAKPESLSLGAGSQLVFP